MIIYDFSYVNYICSQQLIDFSQSKNSSAALASAAGGHLATRRKKNMRASERTGIREIRS